MYKMESRQYLEAIKPLYFFMDYYRGGHCVMNKKLILQITSVALALGSAVVSVLIGQIDNEEIKAEVTERVMENLANAVESTKEVA